MELRRYKDILAIKSPQGDMVGFHARNMEVAELSSELWAALQSPDSDVGSDDEAVHIDRGKPVRAVPADAGGRQSVVSHFYPCIANRLTMRREPVGCMARSVRRRAVANRPNLRFRAVCRTFP